MNYTRITKRQAFKLWMEGKEICLHPCKLKFMWSVPLPVKPEDYVASVKFYAELDVKYPPKKDSIWKYANEEELYKRAWDMMYNGWAFYNTNCNMGYYAHYYVREER